jgi:hypothetical protein
MIWKQQLNNLQQSESKTENDGGFIFPLKLNVGYDEEKSTENDQFRENIKTGDCLPASAVPCTLFADENPWRAKVALKGSYKKRYQAECDRRS